MSTIIREVQGKYYEIRLSDLYKTRQDNNLSTELLVSKYATRITDGTLNGVRELETWEVKAQEVIQILRDANQTIKDINQIYKGI